MDWLVSDVIIYFSLADNFTFARDYALGYPPGALFIFLLPRLFTSDVTAYFLIFSLLMAVFFSIKVLLLARLWEKTNRDVFWLPFLIISGALLLPLTLIRFDLVPVTLVMVALVLLLRSSSFWPEFLLALGTLVKIFPATLLPIFIIHFWRKREKTRLVKGLAVYLLTLAVFLTPFVFFDGGGGIVGDLNHQSARPMEIESLPASIFLAGALLGQPVKTFFDAGSWNVTIEGWEEAVNKLFLFFWVAGLALFYLWFFRQGAGKSFSGQKTPIQIVQASLIVLLVFVAFHRVFSPQYLIWLEPIVLWFLLGVSRRKMIILGCLWCLILILTMFNLRNFWSLIALSQSIMLTQILRNVVYLVFLVLVALTREGKNFTSPKLSRKKAVGNIVIKDHQG